jgi:ER lumen protein retaining receptor
LLGAAALLAYQVNYAFTPLALCWSFSIYLEAVAFLPQRALLQRPRGGLGDTVDAYYLAALVAYRAFYIANWVQRCVKVGVG